MQDDRWYCRKLTISCDDYTQELRNLCYTSGEYHNLCNTSEEYLIIPYIYLESVVLYLHGIDLYMTNLVLAVTIVCM